MDYGQLERNGFTEGLCCRAISSLEACSRALFWQLILELLRCSSFIECTILWPVPTLRVDSLLIGTGKSDEQGSLFLGDAISFTGGTVPGLTASIREGRLRAKKG